MIELLVAALLLASGVLVLVAAVGLVRLPDFFQRMHAPSIAYTLASWSVALASIAYFSVLESRASLHVWLIVILLSITAPVTTLLLARAALFRRRLADESAPRRIPGAVEASPGVSAAPVQHLHQQRDGADRADQQQRAADRLALDRVEAVREHERDPGAEHGARAGDEREFGQGQWNDMSAHDDS